MIDTTNPSDLLYVVDVGASGGISPRWRNVVGELKAILFEPDPKEYAKLKATLRDKHIILNMALSDYSRQSELYLCRFQPASSLYLPDREILQRYYTDMGRFDIVDTIKVTTDTLDHQVAKAGVADIDFIKVDAQGHELAILRGASNTLQGAIGVEVEVEFLPVYKNQPLFHDVDAFLQDAGFELFDIKRTYLNRRDKLVYGNRKGQLMWGDALYFKAPEHLLATRSISASKLVRAVQVYLVYNYPDLAETLFLLATEQGILPAARATQVTAWLDAYKVERMNALPNFRGKNRLHRWLSRLTQLLSRKYRSDKQEDEHLGNPF